MRDFTLQIHITDRCTHHCKHCYLKNRDYDQLDSNIIYSTYDKLIDLTNYISGLIGQKVKPIVQLTGGDPLLRKDIFELIEVATSKGIQIGLLGNPDTVTECRVKTLVELGVNSFQISMDGMKDFHDDFRNKSGSFDDSLKAIETLQSNGMRKTFVMCNVSNENINQVPELFSFLKKRNLFGFVFARVCQTGNGKNIDTMISPERYKKLVYKMAEIDGNVFERKEGKTRLVFKDPLWSLYSYELGNLKPTDEIEGGCQAGISLLTMTSSGELYACRRMDVSIGDYRDDFVDVYLNNSVMNQLRDFDNFEKCKSCVILNNCRGCPAISHGVTGNMFSPDQQCWTV